MKMANMDAIFKGLFSCAASQNVSYFCLYFVVFSRMAVSWQPGNSHQVMNEAFFPSTATLI